VTRPTLYGDGGPPAREFPNWITLRRERPAGCARQYLEALRREPDADAGD
jgi:hypothetical protein